MGTLTTESVNATAVKELLSRVVVELVEEMEKPHYHSAGFPRKTALKKRLLELINEANLDEEVHENKY